MPFAKRDAAGRIVALTAEPEPGAEEAVGSDNPEVIDFLRGKDASDARRDRLAAVDGQMARVTEDLIDVLVARGVLMFTDLPPAAQRKLIERQRLRQQREATPPGFVPPDDDALI
jgi:hypothetical protein